MQKHENNLFYCNLKAVWGQISSIYLIREMKVSQDENHYFPEST